MFAREGCCWWFCKPRPRILDILHAEKDIPNPCGWVSICSVPRPLALAPHPPMVACSLLCTPIDLPVHPRVPLGILPSPHRSTTDHASCVGSNVCHYPSSLPSKILPTHGIDARQNITLTAVEKLSNPPRPRSTIQDGWLAHSLGLECKFAPRGPGHGCTMRRRCRGRLTQSLLSRWSWPSRMFELPSPAFQSGTG